MDPLAEGENTRRRWEGGGRKRDDGRDRDRVLCPVVLSPTLVASSFLISSPRMWFRRSEGNNWLLVPTTTATPFRPGLPELRLVLQETVLRDKSRRSRTPPWGSKCPRSGSRKVSDNKKSHFREMSRLPGDTSSFFRVYMPI